MNLQLNSIYGKTKSVDSHFLTGWDEEAVGPILYALTFKYIYLHRRRFFCGFSKFQGGEMFLQSLFELYNSISVRNFGCRPKKKSLRRKLVLFQPGISEFCPRIQVNTKKKIFTAFWFNLSPEFWISCCQVGITYHKTEGARHISPPSSVKPEGAPPPPPPRNRRQCLLVA